jgi:ribonucleoside-diphosphate reductase alpha chain
MCDRAQLQDVREGLTHRFVIRAAEAEHKGYLIVGLAEDGRVGEIYLKMDRQGGTVSGFCDAWSMAVSRLLQTGTPLDEVCRMFRSTRFEPSGRTESRDVPFAQSPVDYVCRYLELRFLGVRPFIRPEMPEIRPPQPAAAVHP